MSPLRSIRGRITLVVGLVTGVLSCATSIAFARALWQANENAAGQRLSDLAAVDAGIVTVNAKEGLPLDDGIGAYEDTFSIIYDADGNVLFSYGARNADELTSLEQQAVPGSLAPGEVWSGFATTDLSEWRTTGVPCEVETDCLAIARGERMIRWRDDLRSRLPFLAAFIAGAVAIAVLGTRWIVGRSLRPVETMRAELDTITSGDLDRRIPVPPTGHELADLATSFNTTIERIGAGVQAQRRFTSDAAHELRSPLAGIRATLEVAAGKPDRADQAIATALGQIDRASDVIDNLLVLARREGGASPLPMKAADLDDLVRLEVREFRLRHPEVAIDAPSVPPVQAVVHGESITRVVRNLLENAARHGGTQVVVTLTRAGDDWVIRVDDNGPGIPAAERERIFERFARLDASRARSTGGSGLGLAIVRETMIAHGGTARVAHSSFGGAAFELLAPIGLGSSDNGNQVDDSV